MSGARTTAPGLSVTVVLRVTQTAAYVAFPACLAEREHTPGLSTITLKPLTLQIEVVLDMSVTGSPEVTFTSAKKGGVGMDMPPGIVRVMVCGIFASTTP